MSAAPQLLRSTARWRLRSGSARRIFTGGGKRRPNEIARLLADNPHTTLQVVLEPTGDPERLTVETLQLLLGHLLRNHNLSRSLLQHAPGPAAGVEAFGRVAAGGAAERDEQVLEGERGRVRNVRVA